MQQVWTGSGDKVVRLRLPDPDETVLPGVCWGRPDRPLTPAYWAVRCQGDMLEERSFVSRSGSLVEEVAFCILGGFGITYEINAAAFDKLKTLGAFVDDADHSENWIYDQLCEPLQVGGRAIRYRFPRQRARRLHAMRAGLDGVDCVTMSALDLRRKLLELEGVGPKTASWIVRNLLGTDEVAILDVHVLRACKAMQLFPDAVSLPRDYVPLEKRFLAFASAIAVRASILDMVMWAEMRRGRSALAV
jgi:thermostable 8-oxoguanine DNA glycosylase